METPLSELPIPSRSLRGFLVVLGLVLTLAIAAGFWIYRTEEARADLKAHVGMEAIARLKVDQIVQWRGERLADAIDMQSRRILMDALSQWTAHPHPEHLATIWHHLLELRDTRRLRDVMVVDAGGHLGEFRETLEPVDVEMTVL